MRGRIKRLIGVLSNFDFLVFDVSRLLRGLDLTLRVAFSRKSANASFLCRNRTVLGTRSFRFALFPVGMECIELDQLSERRRRIFCFYLE